MSEGEQLRLPHVSGRRLRCWREPLDPGRTPCDYACEGKVAGRCAWSDAVGGEEWARTPLWFALSEVVGDRPASFACLHLDGRPDPQGEARRLEVLVRVGGRAAALAWLAEELPDEDWHRAYRGRALGRVPVAPG